MQQQHIVLLLIIAVLSYFMYSDIIEPFNTAGYQNRQYKQDVANLAAYVGPYVTEVYEYLRVKYFNPASDNAPIAYIPVLNDPTLADPLLVTVRTQVRAWIDSATFKMKQNYGTNFATFQKNDGLSYSVNPDSTLTLTYTVNGKPSVYIV